LRRLEPPLEHAHQARIQLVTRKQIPRHGLPGGEEVFIGDALLARALRDAAAKLGKELVEPHAAHDVGGDGGRGYFGACGRGFAGDGGWRNEECERNKSRAETHLSIPPICADGPHCRPGEPSGCSLYLSADAKPIVNHDARRLTEYEEEMSGNPPSVVQVRQPRRDAGGSVSSRRSRRWQYLEPRPGGRFSRFRRYVLDARHRRSIAAGVEHLLQGLGV